MRLNGAFVVAEVALACLLVIAAGLLLTSLRSLLGPDLGMRPDLVAAAQLNLPSERYNDIERRSTFVRSVLDGLREMPGIYAAAIINTLPFDPEGIGLRFRADDDDAAASSGAQTSGFSRFLVVSPGYFDTIGIRLVSGRDLTWSDRNDVPVAVINRTMAQMFWPGEDPLRLFHTERTGTETTEFSLPAGLAAGRTTPLARPAAAFPDFHDGSAADLPALVAHYNRYSGVEPGADGRPGSST